MHTASPRTVFPVTPPCCPYPPSLPCCPILGTHLPITFIVQLWSLQWTTLSFISESNDNLAFVAQHLRDGKTHHTHKVVSPEIGELCMKNIFFGTLLGKDLLLFGTFRIRLNVFFKDMLFLTCWNLKPSSHPHNEVHWLRAWSEDGLFR